MINQIDIDRLGVDAFANNIFANIQEDVNGGQPTKAIEEYYFSRYGIDITFSEEYANIRFYTESEGWKQMTAKINFNVKSHSNTNR